MRQAAWLLVLMVSGALPEYDALLRAAPCVQNVQVLRDPAGRFRHSTLADIDAHGQFASLTSSQTPQVALLRFRTDPLHPGEVLFAPSTEAVAYAREGITWAAAPFERRIPGEGHVFYRGPPALTLPHAWRGARTIYVYVSGRNANTCIRATSIAAVFTNEPAHNALILYYGALMGIGLFMLGVFVISREAVVAWYLTYLAVLLFYQLVRQNVLWNLTAPYQPLHGWDVEFSAFALTLIAHVQFARVFLQTNVHAPRLDRALLAVVAAILVYQPLAAIAATALNVHPDPHGAILAAILATDATLVLAAAILRITQGDRSARFFLGGYAMLFFFTSLAVAQWLTGSRYALGLYGSEIGTVAEFGLFALGIGDRLRRGRVLAGVVAGLPEVILRVRRDGRISFATPNAAALFARAERSLTGLHVRELVAPDSWIALRELARKAVRPGRREAPAHARLREEPHRAVDALVRAERNAHGRITEIQVSLRETVEEGVLAQIPAHAEGFAEGKERVRVMLFGGAVRANGTDVKLTPREFELLAAIALQDGDLDAQALCAQLWIDLDQRSATSALQTTLSRLRKKLPAGSIVSAHSRYGLGEDVGVDVRDLKTAIRSGNTGDLARLEKEVTLPLPPGLARCEWFEPFKTTVEMLRREALTQLGESALERGDAAAALHVAELLLDLDVADESGYTLAIRAHLYSGDGSSVQRVFADCRRALEAELGEKPSRELRALAESAPRTRDS